MHEQSFEKRVQQKMDELSLTPSAPVWQKVEEQIRKKKERRRVLFWILPLLLVGGGAYWLLSGTGRTAAPVSSHTSEPSTTVAPVQAPAQPAETNTTNNDNQTITKTNATSLPYTEPVENNHSITIKSTATQNISFVQKAEKPGKKRASANVPVVTDGEEVVVTEDAVVKNEVAPNKITATDTATVVETNTKTPTVEPKAPEDAVTETKPEATDTTAAAPAPTAKPAKKSKWRFAVHAEAGLTSIQSGLIPMPSTRDVFASPNLSSGGSNFFSPTPLLMENGPSFAAGFTAKRVLNGRASVTTGLQYTYYSTRSNVGQSVRNDTVLVRQNRSVALNSYYQSGSQNEYTNSFHFIQVPIGIEYRLLKKAPLYIHSGATVARMVASNALLYDYNFNIFYKNKAAFQSTQLHLFTNITYTIWKRNNKEVNLGPYAQYGLTELQKGTGEQSRLFSAGLRTQFSF
jgi:hypothetical protein